MIVVKELIRLIRYKQQDNNEIKFSDYDIMQALNECIRYVNQVYAMRNSDFLEKIYEYREDEINAEIAEYNDSLGEGMLGKPFVYFAKTGIELPDDFVTLVGVTRVSDEYSLHPISNAKTVTCDTYKILDGKLFVGDKAVNMLYRRMVKDVVNENDTVDIPLFFKDVIVKTTGLILNNQPTDVLMDAIISNANAIIPSRKYSNAKRKMPF